MTRVLATMIFAVCALLASGGCAVWGPEGGPAAQGAPVATASAQARTGTAIKGSDGIARITVTVTDDLTLDPATVYAPPGILEITFRNAGITPHDIGMQVPGGAGSGNLNGSETRTITVTADRGGTYPMPCLYHGTTGMRGTLIIE